MDYTKLTPKVSAVLAEHPDWTDQQVADSLNEPTVTTTYSRFVTFRTLLSELPAAQAMSIIGKIKAAAAADPNGVLAEILPSLKDTAEGCGIDMQNANARGFVDAMTGESPGMFTADEAAAVKGMAERIVSWAASEGLEPVGDGHVRSARGMI